MATELPGELAPEGAHFRPVPLDGGRARLEGGSHERDPPHPHPREIRVAAGGDELLDLLRQVVRRGAAEQMVEREHRMGLAAAEIRLEVHHGAGVPIAVQPAQRPGQEVVQALGEVGAAEELHRVPVFRAHGLPGVDEVQVGGELRGGEFAARHIVMGPDHVPPGFQARTRVEGHPFGLPAVLLLEHGALEVHSQLADVRRRVHRVDGVQQALDGVKGADGVIGAELLVVGPPIAGFPQFGGEALLRAGKHVLEVEALLGDRPQLDLNVPLRHRAHGAAVFGGVLRRPSGRPVGRVESLSHDRIDCVQQSFGQQVESPADPLPVVHRHDRLLNVTFPHVFSARSGIDAPAV